MHWTVVLLAVTAAACASAATETRSDLGRAPEPPPTLETTGDGYMFRLSRDDGMAVTTFESDRSTVFQALLGAFEGLELPIAGADRTRGIIQSGPVRATRRLAGRRMSELFNCGSTLTGNRADSWRLEIDVSGQVQSAGADDARLTTRVTAFARPTDGTSTNAVPCSTTGRLEQMIAESIASKVTAE